MAYQANQNPNAGVGDAFLAKPGAVPMGGTVQHITFIGAQVTPKAKTLISLAGALALLIIIASGINIIAFAIRVAELSSNGYYYDTGTLWVSPIVSVIIVLLLPCCAYFGARDRNAPLLILSGLCNGICGICSLIGLAGFAMALAHTYSFLSEYFYVAYYWQAWICLVILVFEVPLFFYTAFLSFQVHGEVQRQVVTMRAAPPQVTVVQAQPGVIQAGTIAGSKV